MAYTAKKSNIALKINSYVSAASLQAYFDNEWVLLVNPKFNEKQELLGGNFIYHHKDRNKVSAKAKSLPSPKSIKVFYTGEYENEGEEFFL